MMELFLTGSLRFPIVCLPFAETEAFAIKPSDFSEYPGEYEGISNKFEMTHLQQRNQYTPPRTRGTTHPSHSFTMLYCRVLMYLIFIVI